MYCPNIHDVPYRLIESVLSTLVIDTYVNFDLLILQCGRVIIFSFRCFHILYKEMMTSQPIYSFENVS